MEVLPVCLWNFIFPSLALGLTLSEHLLYARYAEHLLYACSEHNRYSRYSYRIGYLKKILVSWLLILGGWGWGVGAVIYYYTSEGIV